jgi:hypothetical protein
LIRWKYAHNGGKQQDHVMRNRQKGTLDVHIYLGVEVSQDNRKCWCWREQAGSYMMAHCLESSSCCVWHWLSWVWKLIPKPNSPLSFSFGKSNYGVRS